MYRQTPSSTSIDAWMRHKRIIGTVEKFVNSMRQDSTSMNLMTEVIKCDAIEQSKLIKTWL